MWREETKADIANKQSIAQRKYAKELGWNPGYTQKHSVEKGAREYREQQEYYRQQEQRKIDEIERKEQEKQDLINKIESVQNHEQAFTPAELYKAGLAAREQGDGIEATMRFWQALICGEDRAAFPLFEMLRDGEGGIPQNMEIARLILGTGQGFGSAECRAYGYVYMSDLLKATDALEDVCFYSFKFIKKPDYKITDEIMFERLDAADEALNDFHLQTRSHQQTMQDALQHPMMVEEKLDEVHITGDNDIGGTKFCCIL